MEISEETYRGFGWNEKTIIWDETQDIFNPGPIFDILGYVAEENRKIVSESERRLALKIFFAQQCGLIEHRYNNQRWTYEPSIGWGMNRALTSKQKHRIRKQKNKWRKRILGE